MNNPNQWRDELINKKKQILDRDELDLQIEALNRKRSQFASVRAGDVVILNKQLLFDIIEKRINESKVKIEDLFLMCKAPNGLEGDQKVDTPYGKLRVFFINKDLRSSWLLHTSKYNYPVISKISTKGSHTKQSSEEIVEEAVRKSNIFTKDLTSQANESIKSDYKVS